MAQAIPWLETLNQLGQKWIVEKENNEAAYIALRNEAMLIIYAHEVEISADLVGAKVALASVSTSKPRRGIGIPEYKTTAAVKVLEYLDRYDPTINDSLGAYIQQRLKWKQAEELEKENKSKQHVWVEDEEPKTGKPIKKQKAIPNLSLEESAENAPALLDTLADPHEIYDPTHDYISIMIAMVLNFKLKQKPSSRTEMNYQSYRMCFTEKIAKLGYDGFPLEQEADIFRAMLLGYLDYFMREPCRDIPALRRSPRKRLEELFPGEATGELTWNSSAWLPAKVPLAFLEKIGVFVSNTTISERRGKYTKELESLFFGS